MLNCVCYNQCSKIRSRCSLSRRLALVKNMAIPTNLLRKFRSKIEKTTNLLRNAIRSKQYQFRTKFCYECKRGNIIATILLRIIRGYRIDTILLRNFPLVLQNSHDFATKNLWLHETLYPKYVLTP